MKTWTRSRSVIPQCISEDVDLLAGVQSGRSVWVPFTVEKTGDEERDIRCPESIKNHRIVAEAEEKHIFFLP